jgi:hypothetical protein
MGACGDGGAFRAFFAKNGAKVKERVRKGCATRQRTAVLAFACACSAVCAHAPNAPRALPPRSVPNQLRGVIWQLLSGSRELRLRNADLYEQARPRCSPLLSPANASLFTHTHASLTLRAPPRCDTAAAGHERVRG